MLAGVPSQRAAVAIAALRAGKHVLSDKPGVTTSDQLARIRSAVAERTGRPWTVLFSERFGNRAIGAAVEMARDGAIGAIVHVVGAGPHLLDAARRPDWFWDDASTGGILVDIGSHQADQFLAVAAGADGTPGEVRRASVGNVACPDHPAMQDIGSMTLVANGVVGDHRLDYLTADGLGTWGDVRLTIVGTDGVIEARANVDVAGQPGAEHLLVVDADGTRRVDVSQRRRRLGGVAPGRPRRRRRTSDASDTRLRGVRSGAPRPAERDTMGHMMGDLRVGVVGLGVGRAHVRSWSDVEGASVVVVADVDEERRRDVEEQWGVAAVDSLDAVLATGVDVVDLCTPPSMHEAQIERCLATGVHVICEKPLVDSVAACERLRVMSQHALVTSGARLMPIFQYRFGDGAHQARALVDAGLTGRLYTASASTWWRRGRGYYTEAPWRGTWLGERGGAVLTHSIHVHDLLTWIGGPLAEIRAMATTHVNEIETEDCAVAIGRTVDGGLTSMNVSLGAATESSRLVWCFEHVTIESSTSPYDPAAGPWTFEFKRSPVAESAERVLAEVTTTKPLYTGQFQDFVDRLGDGGPFSITLDDAQASLELVTAWYRSARTGSVEALPLPPDHPDRDSWRPSGVD